MKKKLLVGLCLAFGASVISGRAEDTPAQAAARAALEQKWGELNNPQTQPPPAKPSGAEATKPGNSATKVTDAAPATAVTPKTAPAAAESVEIGRAHV